MEQQSHDLLEENSSGSELDVENGNECRGVEMESNKTLQQKQTVGVSVGLYSAPQPQPQSSLEAEKELQEVSRPLPVGAHHPNVEFEMSEDNTASARNSGSDFSFGITCNRYMNESIIFTYVFMLCVYLTIDLYPVFNFTCDANKNIQKNHSIWTISAVTPHLYLVVKAISVIALIMLFLVAAPSFIRRHDRIFREENKSFSDTATEWIGNKSKTFKCIGILLLLFDLIWYTFGWIVYNDMTHKHNITCDVRMIQFYLVIQILPLLQICAFYPLVVCCVDAHFKIRTWCGLERGYCPC